MPPAALTLPALGLLLCLPAFVPGRQRWLPCMLRGVGLQALLVLPVGVAQTLWVIGADDFPDLLAAPLAGVPFNMGGLLCAAAFESIDRAGLLGTRQSTVIDNLGVYYPLVIAQAGVIAAIIAARTRQTGRVLADRAIMVALGLVLVNAVLGVTWPWWGT